MSDNIYAEIGNRIKEARKQKGLTQTELGAYINVDKTGMNRYESGKAIAMSYEKLLKLSKALDVTVEWLWEGTGPMKVISVDDLNQEQIQDLNEYKLFLKQKGEKSGKETK